MISYHTAQTTGELQQILDLQLSNLPVTISERELKAEGFVTVHHDLETLQAMNESYGHILAKENDQVIGYALVMLREFEKRIPVLVSMFQKINAIEYQGEKLGNTSYFTMGQVCIAKGYRGQGIFKGLYQKMKEVMSPHFRYLITEVDERNPRSMRAHHKVGFKDILHYKGDKGEDWVILLWDWT